MRFLKPAIMAMAAFVFFTAASAQAQQAIDHPGLKKFIEEGGKVDYLGNLYGLDGWVVSMGEAEPRTVYTNKQGAMVMGILMSADGTVETQKQLVGLKNRIEGSQTAMPGAEKSNGAKVERLYAEIEKANWLKIGAEDAPYIYVIMNVNCDHCQNYWKDLQPQIKAGRVQVRLLPFGKADANRDGGAALLSVANPGDAWLEYIGGKTELLAKDKAVIDRYGDIDANTALVNKWKLQGTPPYTIYRKRSDGKIVAIIGRPKNMMLLQADLLK